MENEKAKTCHRTQSTSSLSFVSSCTSISSAKATTSAGTASNCAIDAVMAEFESKTSRELMGGEGGEEKAKTEKRAVGRMATDWPWGGRDMC